KDADADVQAVRAASNRAQAMLSDKQAIRRNGKLVEVGDGLYNILAPIKKLGTQVWVDFQDFLFHRHNISRMSLDKRSIERINAEKEKLSRMTNELIAKSAELKALNAEIASLNGVSGRDATVKRQSLTEKRKALNAEKRALTASCKALEKTISEMKVEENKPIFGYEKDGEKIAYTAEESRLYAEELSRRYPDFKKYAEKVYSYLDNLQKERLDAGLISEELYNELKEKYPYYVPTMRAEAPSGTAGIGGKYNLAVKQTVKTAKGSFRDLESLELSISRMTEEVIRAAEVNRLALSLAKAAESSGDVRFIDLEGMESGGKVTADSVNEQIEERKPVPVKQNQITMYRNGEQLTVSVAPEVFAGFDAWNPKVDMAALPIEAMAFANKTFKRLVTSLNPFFLVRNAIRDIQDAGINTRFPLKFVKNYARAVVEITKNGELWRMYREAGGLSSTVFDYNKGFKAKPTKMGFTASENKILALFGKMETINMFIEQLPRLAEFISSVEAGNTVNRALLDSADVTTNFARVGKTAKELNRTVIPFLNPAIQGMSKIVRNFSEAFDYRHPRQAVKAFAVLSIKAMLLGIVPQVLNQLMYEDDEDYEELRDSDKETYFLLKIGDTFFKLPKGRVSAVLAGAVNRTSQAVKGESVDWADYVKSISSNVTPIENFSRTIFQPFFEFFTNTTWYGGQIEGQEFDNVRPRDRYDESTSSIAIALGKTFNYSPKKIHYLLDQYSGVIGDFFLPLTTQQVENGVSGNVILDTAFSNFTVDPVTQNKLSSEFYDIYEETMYAKTEGDISAKYKLKYLNSVKSAISELYDERVKIQTSNLTSYEKLQQTRVIQALINETYRSATASLDTFAQAIRATEGIYDETDPAGEKMRYTEITRICFGAEKALEKYGASVYKSAESFKKAGISYEDYYNLYFSTKDITSDITVHGETVSGSKRAKMLTAINRTGLDVRERMLYFTSRGYSIKDGDFGGMTAIRAKKMLLSYILSQPGLTSAEKAELAEKCGFEVKNGRIITPKS
ncbi:MAG: hypothetical protein IJW48_04805, partial [Clostridia bacterium]|nr:hypothetical protein [Clostridia bacterium]